jgi:drug/metabolite transporter (DMT)-like permease
MSANQTRGIRLAIITALISGISIFVNKLAVSAIEPPLVFTATKNASVGLFILGILLATKKWQQFKKLTRREFIYLILIGIIGGSLPFYLYFTGLSQIPAINAALIHKTLVLWVAILAVPFLREKLTSIQILGVTLLFGSNLAIGGFQGFQFSFGELLVLAATILWAVENILAKKILFSLDPDLVVAARMGFGSIILLISSSLVYPQALGNIINLNFTQWLWLIITAAFLFGYVMTWYRALKLAPATTVASVLVASTLVTNVLSALFVARALTPLLILQALLAISGIGLLFWSTSLVQKERFFSSRAVKILTAQPQ